MHALEMANLLNLRRRDAFILGVIVVIICTESMNSVLHQRAFTRVPAAYHSCKAPLTDGSLQQSPGWHWSSTTLQLGTTHARFDPAKACRQAPDQQRKASRQQSSPSLQASPGPAPACRPWSSTSLQASTRPAQTYRQANIPAPA